MKKLMIIDDEERAAKDIAAILDKDGYNAAVFTSSSDALKALDALTDIDLVLTDIRMPVVGGMDIVKAAAARKRPVPVIVFSGFGDVDAAVEIMKAGASDFMCKPVSAKELVIRVRRVLEKQELADELASLRKRVETNESFQEIVGKSKKMLAVYELIESVARTDATVIIRGETGTGKELVARAIHNSSHRREKPFVAISCTALQHTLLESELFGHEKGSFTGAHALKVGRLETADEGTVLLDEVGDTSQEIQVKLLRVLQEREFERVGGVKPVRFRARVLAATNRNIEDAVKDGSFRQDLYYRLNVVSVELPPLREREGDVMLLADHFLDLYKRRHGRNIEGFAPSAVDELLTYPWPGNVRELMNAIERTVLTSHKRFIDRISMTGDGAGAAPRLMGLSGARSFSEAKTSAIGEIEKAYLVRYLTQESGRINRVAELLGVSTRTVARQMTRYGLDKKSFKKKPAR